MENREVAGLETPEETGNAERSEAHAREGRAEPGLLEMVERLKGQDRALRESLESAFADDRSFNELAEETFGYLAKLEGSGLTGIEKARTLAAARKTFMLLLETERAKASSSFIETGGRLEQAEADLDEIERM